MQEYNFYRLNTGEDGYIFGITYPNDSLILYTNSNIINVGLKYNIVFRDIFIGHISQKAFDLLNHYDKSI